jgi:hypothetical protein
VQLGAAQWWALVGSNYARLGRSQFADADMMPSFMLITILVGLVSAVIGGFVGTRYQRHHATWLKRRDSAAEAYEASISVNSAMNSSLAFARRATSALSAVASEEFQRVAHDADWQLSGYLEAMKTSVARLRDAELRARV